MSCINCGSTDIVCKNKCKKCYMKEWGKEHRKKNKQKIKLRNQEYNQTENGKKSERISKWRHRGLIDSDNDNYEKIHQRYLDTTHCDLCNIELTEDSSITGKQMEHCHKTKLFRNIVCHKCNIKIRDKETPCRSNTGIKNITYVNKKKLYEYRKMVDGETYQKYFKTIGEALAHKIIHNVLLKRLNE